jgi:peptidoglycan/xylan/chitin deacetylase (PgdA/CDA1 family)
MSGAVILTFELDVEEFWLGLDPATAERPKTLSLGRYGITRGMERIFALLEAHAVPSTWFVPGSIARRYPDAVRSIGERGHELASRGWDHTALGGSSIERQRADIAQGLAVLEDITGDRPRGFRAPRGEVDNTTFLAAEAEGIEWSSCLRSGEAPAVVVVDGRPTIPDLGSRWELTDYVHFQFNYGPSFPRGQNRIASYSEVLDEWVADAIATSAMDLPCVFTLTPEVMGKPGRALLLERLIQRVLDSGVEFATAGSQFAPPHVSERTRVSAP